MDKQEKDLIIKGKSYGLIYYDGWGKLYGPRTQRVGTAPLAAEVEASSISEAEELLIKKIIGNPTKG